MCICLRQIFRNSWAVLKLGMEWPGLWGLPPPPTPTAPHVSPTPYDQFKPCTLINPLPDRELALIKIDTSEICRLFI